MTNEQIRDFLGETCGKAVQRFYQQPDSGDRFDSGSAASGAALAGEAARKGRMENLS